jgi:hypothetical protein
MCNEKYQPCIQTRATGCFAHHGVREYRAARSVIALRFPALKSCPSAISGWSDFNAFARQCKDSGFQSSFGWNASVVRTHSTMTFPACAGRKELRHCRRHRRRNRIHLHQQPRRRRWKQPQSWRSFAGSGRLPPQPLASSAARASSRGRKNLHGTLMKPPRCALRRGVLDEHRRHAGTNRHRSRKQGTRSVE